VDRAIDLISGMELSSRFIYRLSFKKTNELKKQLDELLEKGYIRPSVSPFDAPVLFVHKKDRTL
jgi:hypothetical protein